MGLTNIAIPSTPHHFYPPAGSCAGKKKTWRLSHVPGLFLDLQQTPFGFYFFYLHNPDQSVEDRFPVTARRNPSSASCYWNK